MPGLRWLRIQIVIVGASISIAVICIAIVTLINVILVFLVQILATPPLAFQSRGTLNATRKMSLTEFRFKVDFEIPVIFLGGTNITRRPIRNQPFWVLDGHNEDYFFPEAHHIPENEGWKMPLSAIQRMERHSKQWQANQLGQLDIEAAPELENRTVSIAVQHQTYSADDLDRLCAITTISNLIALVALLGLHWVLFEPDRDLYRAEGNGYLLQGRFISRLGLAFEFQSDNMNKFEEKRIIPAIEIKELCFGLVPTLFRDIEGEDDIFTSLDDVNKFGSVDHFESFDTLELGSRSEVADTFTYLGCKPETVETFLGESRRITHLFPVSFELIGMLSRTVHVWDTSFRMLPNPTIHRWSSTSIDLLHLLATFGSRLQQPRYPLQTRQTDDILARIGSIVVLYDVEPRGCSHKLLNEIHRAIDDIDTYLREENRLAIRLTLRTHFDTVLEHLNNGSRTFLKLNSEASFIRERELTRIYFRVIFPAVVGLKSPQEEADTTKHRKHGGATSVIAEHDSDSDSCDEFWLGWDATGLDGRSHRLRKKAGLALGIEDKRANIWYCLMFRAIFWLMLHDFDKR
ncbi:modin, partial [Colletotrichum asianum]